jgi:hypothetical protein
LPPANSGLSGLCRTGNGIYRRTFQRRSSFPTCWRAQEQLFRHHPFATSELVVETPDGNISFARNETAVGPQGPPMNFNVIGTEMWRAVFVVLLDTSQEWITDGGDWTPKGSFSK